MAHVHGEKTVASQVKSVVNAGTAKIMDSSMMKMGMEPIMNEGMGPMMKEGMGSMMKDGMGSMMKDGMSPMMKMGEGMAQVMKHSKTPGVATEVATGAVVSAGSSAGKSVIIKVFTHPLVLFGLGVAVGYYICKYRKSIISASAEAQQEE